MRSENKEEQVVKMEVEVNQRWHKSKSQLARIELIYLKGVTAAIDVDSLAIARFIQSRYDGNR
jgi:hypothetical protein